MIAIRRIRAIIFKEIKQLSRDRMTFAMVVMIPIIQLLLFGFAINTKIRNIPVGLLDYNQTSLSRYVAQAFEGTQVIRFTRHYQTIEKAQSAITSGDVKAVLIIPQDFPARYAQRKQLPRIKNYSQFQYENRSIAQWIVDGTDPVIGNAVQSLVNMPLADVDTFYKMHNQPPANFSLIKYFNPQAKSAINIVPGLVGIILTMTMIMFTSAAIVREKEHGNLEFLITTPVKPFELMIGKITPFIIIGLLQMGLIMILGHLVFAVPITGKIYVVIIACLLFIFASLTLGLVISTIAQTQLQSTQMTIFVLLPSILLSGFMFPYEGMPTLAQWIAECLPTTHFIRMFRAIVLKAAGLQDIFVDAIWLVLFSIIFIIIASLRFKKRLD